jgi:hypothetical protein
MPSPYSLSCTRHLASATSAPLATDLRVPAADRCLRCDIATMNLHTHWVQACKTASNVNASARACQRRLRKHWSTPACRTKR